MRTTVNLRSEHSEVLENAVQQLAIKRNTLVALLISKLIRNNDFDSRPCETVSYQDNSGGFKWVKVHVSLEPEIYEKAQDLRRHCKFSVSWFVAFAIENFLEDVVNDLMEGDMDEKILDNYEFNFVYIVQKYGNVQGMLTLWGMPEEKYHEKILV